MGLSVPSGMRWESTAPMPYAKRHRPVQSGDQGQSEQEVEMR